MPKADPIAEAEDLSNEADKHGVTLRLLGGVAFRLRCPSSLSENLKRKYMDIDFMGLREQRKEIREFFVERKYEPRRGFNTMQINRLIFNDVANGRRVDIFLDAFEMCHRFDLTSRLSIDKLTLTMADLLLTKLQVYEITDREYRDTIAMFIDHHLSVDDNDGAINQKYIANLCGDDWGLWKTISLNLERIMSVLPKYVDSPVGQKLVKERIDGLWKAIETEPKSMRWKLRARVGERMKWYELPEADREVVDSNAPFMQERNLPGRESEIG
jgi:hypothetical protein